MIVTGANGSIGREITKSLVGRSYHVIMACRDMAIGEVAMREIVATTRCSVSAISLMQLDLSSIACVERFATQLEAQNAKIYGLVNNAGATNRHFSLTADGFESTIAVNYLGIVLLTRLLLPLMAQGAGIANVVSVMAGANRIDKDLFTPAEGQFTQLGSYAKSKAALMVFTASLSEVLHGRITVNAADPGIVSSNIITLNRWFDPLADVLFRPLIKSPARGAIPIVAAVQPSTTGFVFRGKSCSPIHAQFVQHPLKQWLWNETWRLLGRDEVL